MAADPSWQTAWLRRVAPSRLVLTSTVALACVSCGVSSAAGGPVVPSTGAIAPASATTAVPDPVSTVVVEPGDGNRYSSVADLVNNSDAVVVGKVDSVGPSEKRTFGGLIPEGVDNTPVRIAVQNVLAGTASPDEPVIVDYLGTVDQPKTPRTIPSVGDRLLLFLQRSEGNNQTTATHGALAVVLLKTDGTVVAPTRTTENYQDPSAVIDGKKFAGLGEIIKGLKVRSQRPRPTVPDVPVPTSENAG